MAMKTKQNQEGGDESPVMARHVRGSNQSGVRAHNERLVLTLIRQVGPLPKAEIARMTGLSAQTVSVIMRALESEGLLQKGEPVRGKVGQPSVPMNLCRDGAFFFGLKVGRRSLDLILTDFHGNVEGRVHQSHRYPTPKSVVEFTRDGIATLLDKLPRRHHARVAGLGIALPFRLWDWAAPLGLEPGAMDGWRDRDIAAEIAEGRDFPVFMRNDASAACGAELVFGDQNRPRDFLYFFIAFFVGGGLVLDNVLYTGRTGNAGALGSLPIGIHGNEVDQLVDVASLVTLEQALVASGGSADTIWSGTEDWDIPPDVLEAWMAKAVDGLAYATFSAACLIDFEAVMIDGWIPAPIRDDLVARIATRLDELRTSGIEIPAVRPGTIGPDARAMGAASLPLSERFLIDRNAFLIG